jgi:predicted DNA binding CopG/RHH family protein
MKKLATNKDRQENLKRKIAKIPKDASAGDTLAEFYTNFLSQKEQQELDPEWAKNNLEYDLRASEYIVEKCKDEYYAQNIYAALCNNDFRKNEVIPILMEDSWSCSWRYAGGIVADLRGEGDYLDWYCTGIQGDIPDASYNEMTLESKLLYQMRKEKFVGEGYVTDEVREDLSKLGWIVLEQNEELL